MGRWKKEVESTKTIKRSKKYLISLNFQIVFKKCNQFSIILLLQMQIFFFWFPHSTLFNFFAPNLKFDTMTQNVIGIFIPSTNDARDAAAVEVAATTE